MSRVQASIEWPRTCFRSIYFRAGCHAEKDRTVLYKIDSSSCELEKLQDPRFDFRDYFCVQVSEDTVLTFGFWYVLYEKEDDSYV